MNWEQPSEGPQKQQGGKRDKKSLRDRAGVCPILCQWHKSWETLERRAGQHPLVPALGRVTSAAGPTCKEPWLCMQLPSLLTLEKGKAKTAGR